ncbi:MAG: hypothetical protein NTZ09_08060 [Candidatus Hydrogenedentes bacterium]|nr:hypothetical protein [Candidatus Hydrogenedentota bacterium]
MDVKAVQENPRVAAMLGRISQMMDQPAPRRVPSEIWRRARSPIALFLLLMGVGFTIFIAIMFSVVDPPKEGESRLPALIVVAPLAVAIVGLHRLAVTRKVLSRGRLYKGKVVALKPLPAWINGRTFFSAAVEFEGPAGAKMRGKDTIDDWCSEYFLMARDTGEDVEVIYAPNSIGKALLPMKIAIGNRYD